MANFSVRDEIDRGRKRSQHLTISAVSVHIEKEKCPALEADKCSIYGIRPLTCRTVPFHYSRPNSVLANYLDNFANTPGHLCKTTPDAPLVFGSGSFVLLGEIGDQAVTTCTLVVVPNLTRGGRSYAVIENVVTHPDFRKQGMGRAILDDAVRRARDANCYKVVLTTGSKRESTLSFYEKAGFSRNTRTAFEQRF